MKILRIFICAVFLLTASVPAFADSFSSKFGTMHMSQKLNRSMLQAETAAYLALPGVSLTGAQIAALDANIRAIKYGSGITLEGVTGSADPTADGAYISAPAVDGVPIDLRMFVGFKATVTDASGEAVGFIKEGTVP